METTFSKDFSRKTHLEKAYLEGLGNKFRGEVYKLPDAYEGIVRHREWWLVRHCKVHTPEGVVRDGTELVYMIGMLPYGTYIESTGGRQRVMAQSYLSL